MIIIKILIIMTQISQSHLHFCMVENMSVDILSNNCLKYSPLKDWEGFWIRSSKCEILEVLLLLYLRYYAVSFFNRLFKLCLSLEAFVYWATHICSIQFFCGNHWEFNYARSHSCVKLTIVTIVYVDSVKSWEEQSLW